jgi:hypothetical protein
MLSYCLIFFFIILQVDCLENNVGGRARSIRQNLWDLESVALNFS